MKIKHKYQRGDTRIIEKFLLLPRTIRGETRWLEKAKIKQLYEFTYDFVIPCQEWTDICWED